MCAQVHSCLCLALSARCLVVDTTSACKFGKVKTSAKTIFMLFADDARPAASFWRRWRHDHVPKSARATHHDHTTLGSAWLMMAASTMCSLKIRPA